MDKVGSFADRHGNGVELAASSGCAIRTAKPIKHRRQYGGCVYGEPAAVGSIHR